MKSRKRHQRKPTQLGPPDASNLGHKNTEHKANEEEKAMVTDLQPVHKPPSAYSAPLENDLPPSAFLPMVDVGVSSDNPPSSFSLGDSYTIGDEELRDVFLSIVSNVYDDTPHQILSQDSDERREKDSLPPLSMDDCSNLQAENEGEDEERELDSEASETNSSEGRKNRKRKREALPKEGEKAAGQQEDEKKQQGEKHDPMAKGKTKKRRRRRKAAVPRPTNCFLIFANDFRTALRQRYPNMSNKEVSVHLGRIWKKLSDKDKQPYLHKAAEMKEAHKRAYPHYTYGVPRKVNRGKNFNPRSNRHTTSRAYNENTPQHHLHNTSDNPADVIDGSTYNHPLTQQRTHSLPSSPPPTQQSPLSQQHPHMPPHPQQTYSPSFGTEAFEESLYAETMDVMGDPSSMARAYEINPSATENAETSIAHAIWEQYKFANADRLGLNLPAHTQPSYHQHPPTYPTSTTSTSRPYRPRNPQSMPDPFAKEPSQSSFNFDRM